MKKLWQIIYYFWVSPGIIIAAHILATSNDPPPATMSQSFDRLLALDVIEEETALRMRNAIGFRNISVHEYQKIDWLIVYRIITEHLEDFRDFARQVFEWSNGQYGSC